MSMKKVKLGSNNPIFRQLRDIRIKVVESMDDLQRELNDARDEIEEIVNDGGWFNEENQKVAEELLEFYEDSLESFDEAYESFDKESDGQLRGFTEDESSGSGY